MALELSNPNFKLNVTSTLKNVLTDEGEASVPHLSLNHSPNLTEGIGDNQLNRSWESKSRVLETGAQDVFNLRTMEGQTLVQVPAGMVLDSLSLSTKLC